MMADAGHDLKRELIARRCALGSGRQDIAAAIGVPLSEVVEFEEYNSDPALSFVRRYASAVGVRVRHVVVDLS